MLTTELQWQNADKAKPTPDVPVLVICLGPGPYFARAVWIPKGFQEDDGEYEGECDYDEANNRYTWPEGWYEYNEHETTHWMIDSRDKVLLWASLSRSDLIRLVTGSANAA